LKNQSALAANNPPTSVQAANPAPAALWETVVVTEGAIEAYEWVDENELPRKGPAKASSGLLVARARAAINPFQFIGQKINLEGLLIGGGSLDWESFRGRMTLVVAWQSSCPTCRAELPLVSGLLEHFQNRDLVAVGVCLDQDTTQVSKFLFDRKISWPTIAGPDAEKWVARHGIGQVPSIMLLDAEGKLLAISNHIVDLVSQIELSVRQSASPTGSDNSKATDGTDETERQSGADQ
jgi:thiol-disulfide isomerase/thioredoxin